MTAGGDSPIRGAATERLARTYLEPAFPEFRAHRSLFYRREATMLLHGVSFDTSGFDAHHVYLEAFVQPLFVPREYLVFTFGKRLRRGRREIWDFGGDPEASMRDVISALEREALPLFAKLDDVERFAASARRVADDSNPAVLEPIAYAHLLLGDSGRTRRTLERALSIENSSEYPRSRNDERGWGRSCSSWLRVN